MIVNMFVIVSMFVFYHLRLFPLSIVANTISNDNNISQIIVIILIPLLTSQQKAVYY